MKRVVVTTMAVALVGAGTTPARAQNREHQQMAAELRIVQERQQEQALQLEKLTTALTDAIKAITTRLDTSDAATRKALADDKTILDNVNTTLRAISERTSDTNSRIGTLREEIAALSAIVAAAPSAARQDTSSSGTEIPGGAAPAAPAPSLPSGLTPSRLYDTAWADYTSGNMPLAISGFETFLREYPRAEKAVDAQFYIAESNMKLKRVPEAIKAYTAVTQNYPNGGDRIPQAYYHLGEAQRSQGQTEAARAAWETVVKKYPDSNGGILAKQRLDGLPPPAAPRP